MDHKMYGMGSSSFAHYPAIAGSYPGLSSGSYPGLTSGLQRSSLASMYSGSSIAGYSHGDWSLHAGSAVGMGVPSGSFLRGDAHREYLSCAAASSSSASIPLSPSMTHGNYPSGVSMPSAYPGMYPPGLYSTGNKVDAGARLYGHPGLDVNTGLHKENTDFSGPESPSMDGGKIITKLETRVILRTHQPSLKMSAMQGMQNTFHFKTQPF